MLFIWNHDGAASRVGSVARKPYFPGWDGEEVQFAVVFLVFLGFSNQQKRLPTECAVIRWLLNPDPKQRPTARQLLESELLPSNLDQEIVREVLRTIHPDSTIYADLMRRLFAREPDPHVDHT